MVIISALPTWARSAYGISAIWLFQILETGVQKELSHEQPAAVNFVWFKLRPVFHDSVPNHFQVELFWKHFARYQKTVPAVELWKYAKINFSQLQNQKYVFHWLAWLNVQVTTGCDGSWRAWLLQVDTQYNIGLEIYSCMFQLNGECSFWIYSNYQVRMPPPPYHNYVSKLSCVTS